MSPATQAPVFCLLVTITRRVSGCSFKFKNFKTIENFPSKNIGLLVGKPEPGWLQAMSVWPACDHALFPLLPGSFFVYRRVVFPICIRIERLWKGEMTRAPHHSCPAFPLNLWCLRCLLTLSFLSFLLFLSEKNL